MNNKYIEDLSRQYNRVNFKYLSNKNIIVTGANGLICSYLIDLFIYANTYKKANIKIYALSRNYEKLKNRFNYYFDNKLFIPVIQDVCDEIKIPNKIDFIIHGASNASPKACINDPVGTMDANYLGSRNLLELAKKDSSKILYISSGDVYGKTDKDLINEADYGYVDILNERNSYSSSKRASETLCYSYYKQYGVDALIVRPSHIYGPTYTSSDSRAISDFIRCVVNNKDIIMKSDGSSIRSYCYVGDTVVGILDVLEKGKSGNAYNISNTNSFVSIKETAQILASLCNKKVIIELPKSEIDKKIDSNNKLIKLNNEKLKELGWDAVYGIKEGLTTTIEILKDYKF